MRSHGACPAIAAALLLAMLVVGGCSSSLAARRVDRSAPAGDVGTSTQASSPDAGSQAHYDLPIENLEGIVLVRATLRSTTGRDTTGWLVLDTGAGFLALDTGLSRFLGIIEPKASYNQLEIAERRVSRLTLGELQMDQVGPVLVFDAEVVRSVTDRPVLGLLGEQTLNGFAARLDYGKQTLKLVAVPMAEPIRPRPEDASEGARSPIALPEGERVKRSRAALGSLIARAAIPVPYDRTDDGKMLVRGHVSDPKPPRNSRPLRLVVDTGASKSVLFASRISRMAPRHEQWPSLKGLTAPTLMGSAEAWLSRVPRFDVSGAFGTARATNVDVAILGGELGDALARDVGEPVDGLLGYSFLRQFRSTMDFEQRILWLEPVPHTLDDRPNEYSHVGLQIERRDGALEVSGIASGSPADRAGFERGDKIIAVDGHPVRARDVISVSRMLEGPPGSRVRITIRRESGERTFDLVRRRLL